MVIIADAFREIRKSAKRFLSLMLLVMMAAGFLSGIRSTAPDMKGTAVRYYQDQELMDIRMVSTLGFSEDDLDKVRAYEGVKAAEGSRQLELQLESLVVSVISMPESMNYLYVKSGRLPDKRGECIVDQLLLDHLDVNIGHKITLKRDDEESDEDIASGKNADPVKESDSGKDRVSEKEKSGKETEAEKDTEIETDIEVDTETDTVSTELDDYTYTIVGTCASPLYTSVDRGTSNVGTGTISAFIYVPQEEFDWDYYTTIYVKLQGTEDMSAYTDEYDDYTEGFAKGMESFGDELVAGRYETLRSDAMSIIDDAQQEIDDALTELDTKVSDAQSDIRDAEEELADGRRQLDEAWESYDQMKAAYGEDNPQVVAVKEELDAQQDELDDAERDLAKAKKELEEEKDNARTKIDEAQDKVDNARKDVEDMAKGKSYILDRSSNMGYVSYRQDSDKMADLAKVFPVIFYLVAALSCLTTMTRMIEDHRGEIGTLKALGYGSSLISIKYIGYAFSASFLGGVIGITWGCISIPYIAFTAWQGQYTLPPLILQIIPDICITSVGIAVVAITLTAYLACRAELHSRPARLMRPRAPKAGKRIFLERIGVVWNHLKFTTKVSCRNLFRYQQRFWMTALGIAGCTALLVVGLGLYDAVYAILDKQFSEITYYDASMTTADDILVQDFDAIGDTIRSSDIVAGSSEVFIDITDVSTSSGKKNTTVSGVYLTGVKDISTFNSFVALRHRTDDEGVVFPENTFDSRSNTAGALLTEKLVDVLKVKKGDTVRVTLSDDEVISLTVADIVENYVNNYIYMDIRDLDRLCEDGAVPNEFIFTYTDAAEDEEIDLLSSSLVGMTDAGSYTYIRTIAERFEKSLNAVNAAVMIIIIAAAALAFIVLYNLTNINITERIRELATLKVLGFTDRETTSYIYRENFVMTLLGMLMGLIGGKYLVIWLMTTVENDYMMFGRSVSARSYLIAAGLTIGFSLFVNVAAHFSIQKINMVESLKSVE